MKKLLENSKNYLGYLEEWMRSLSPFRIDTSTSNPEQIAVMVVDMTDGFCSEGPLASPRMKHIVDPITSLLNEAWAFGVKQIFLLNDTHEPNAVEFNSYPPHCIRGTQESLPIKEIRSLKFFDQLQLVPKNSISSNLNTVLGDSLKKFPKLEKFIVVGDCTDLCVYQLAMYLNLDANSKQIGHRQVIVPANCIETYDLSVELAKKIEAIPHPGNLLHAIFLHHMKLNGIEIVREVIFK